VAPGASEKMAARFRFGLLATIGCFVL
jgi:hypothetical protein